MPQSKTQTSKKKPTQCNKIPSILTWIKSSEIHKYILCICFGQINMLAAIGTTIY